MEEVWKDIKGYEGFENIWYGRSYKEIWKEII